MDVEYPPANDRPRFRVRQESTLERLYHRMRGFVGSHRVLCSYIVVVLLIAAVVAFPYLVDKLSKAARTQQSKPYSPTGTGGGSRKPVIPDRTPAPTPVPAPVPKPEQTSGANPRPTSAPTSTPGTPSGQTTPPEKYFASLPANEVVPLSFPAPPAPPAPCYRTCLQSSDVGAKFRACLRDNCMVPGVAYAGTYPTPAEAAGLRFEQAWRRHLYQMQSNPRRGPEHDAHGDQTTLNVMQDPKRRRLTYIEARAALYGFIDNPAAPLPLNVTYFYQHLLYPSPYVPFQPVYSSGARGSASATVTAGGHPTVTLYPPHVASRAMMALSVSRGVSGSSASNLPVPASGGSLTCVYGGHRIDFPAIPIQNLEPLLGKRRRGERDEGSRQAQLATATQPVPLNCEHTVPQSAFKFPVRWENQGAEGRGGRRKRRKPRPVEALKSDLHHMFPTHADINAARSNLPFGRIDVFAILRRREASRRPNERRGRRVVGFSNSQRPSGQQPHGNEHKNNQFASGSAAVEIVGKVNRIVRDLAEDASKFELNLGSLDDELAPTTQSSGVKANAVPGQPASLVNAPTASVSGSNTNVPGQPLKQRSQTKQVDKNSKRVPKEERRRRRKERRQRQIELSTKKSKERTSQSVESATDDETDHDVEKRSRRRRRRHNRRGGRQKSNRRRHSRRQRRRHRRRRRGNKNPRGRKMLALDLPDPDLLPGEDYGEYDKICEYDRIRWYLNTGQQRSSVAESNPDRWGLYSKKNDGLWEPRANHRGDVARALAYMYTFFEGTLKSVAQVHQAEFRTRLSISEPDPNRPSYKYAAWESRTHRCDLPPTVYTPLRLSNRRRRTRDSYTNVPLSGLHPLSGTIIDFIPAQDLHNWHKSDPVDEFERVRNVKVAIVQGNSNPFIENPELLERAFPLSELLLLEKELLVIKENIAKFL